MIMIQPAGSMSRFVFLLILLLVFPVTAQAQRGGGGGGERARSGPGTGNPEEHFPPWRFVEKEPPPVTTPLTLYWLPRSNEEMDRSPLLNSRALLDDSARCVALQAIVPNVPNNAAIAEKLGLAGKLPAAVLIDGHGAIIRRVENAAGVLKPSAVEQMVTEELSARDEAMFHNITEGKRQADAGDKPKAIDLYRRVWDERCLFPLAGQEAQSALKALGVVVEEIPVPLAADPNLSVTPARPPHE
jgi:hypothetical protein